MVRAFASFAALLASLAALALSISAAHHDTPRGPPAKPVASLTDRYQSGVNIATWTADGYDTKQARRAARRAKRLRATAIAIVVTWYQQDAGASTVARHDERTPTDGSVLRLARYARSLGLAVSIKPHVDVLDGTFRGDIAPHDPQRWFRSYERMNGHYARLADEANAGMYVLATELTSMTRPEHEPHWQRIITAARSRFDGMITYAANWDAVDQVTFWDRLDAVGVDAYAPLSGHRDPDRLADELQAGPLGHAAHAAAHAGRPLIVTEVGFRSGRGALRAPWDASTVLPADQAEQAAGYEAAFRAGHRLGAHGMWWWAIPVSAPDDGTGYSPVGKQAARVMRNWHGALNAAR